MKVIFVVGLPRSGTTVFGQNLNKRVKSLYIGESHADSEFFQFKKHISKSRFLELIQFVKSRINLDHHFSTIWNSASKEIINSKRSKFFFKDWINFLYTFGSHAKLDCIIDDTPTNYFYLTNHNYSIKKFHIFAIKRDLRDIMKSHLNAPWSKNNNSSIYLFKYCYFMHLLSKIKSADNSSIIEYEKIGDFFDNIDQKNIVSEIEIEVYNNRLMKNFGRKATKDYEISNPEWVKDHLKKASKPFVKKENKRIHKPSFDNYILSIAQSKYFNIYIIKLIILTVAFIKSRIYRLKYD